jgi:hypothetical protein
MAYKKNKNRKAVTLVELVMAMVITLIVTLAVGILLVSGQRGLSNMWESVHSQARIDSDKFTIMFGAIGRKSNKLEYKLYTVGTNGSFSEAVPTDNSDQVVIADAVEFIYWDQPFNQANAAAMMDTENKGSSYVLFYPLDGQLKADYGSYPPYAINGSSRRAPDRTEIVVEELERVEFTHNTVAGDGKGCIRATVVILDDDTNERLEIKAACTLRNVWPR